MSSTTRTRPRVVIPHGQTHNKDNYQGEDRSDDASPLKDKDVPPPAFVQCVASDKERDQTQNPGRNGQRQDDNGANEEGRGGPAVIIARVHSEKKTNTNPACNHAKNSPYPCDPAPHRDEGGPGAADTNEENNRGKETIADERSGGDKGGHPELSLLICAESVFDGQE